MRVRYAGLCLALWLPCGPAPAAPMGAAHGEQPELETVTVTARRREASAGAIAAAVGQAGRERIAARAPDVPAAVLRGLPGVFFQQTTPGQGLPIVRGLKGSQVLHLVDGMRLNNAFFRDAPNPYFALVDAHAVERIELLRGAAGSLYGADAMGGVVQALTPVPDISGRGTPAENRIYGAFSGADDGWVVRADTHLGREGWGLVGGVTYRDHADRETARGEVTPSAYRSKAADAKLLAQAGERGDLMLSAQVLEQPSTPRVDELVAGFGQDKPASAQFLFHPNRRSFLHGRYHWSARDGWIEDLEIHFARQVITDDRITRDFGSPLLIREDNESELDGLTAQFRHSPSERLQLTWGLEFYRDTVRSARVSSDTRSGLSEPERPRFPDRSRMDHDAVYMTASWNATTRLEVDAGLRYSAFSIRLPPCSDSPGARLSPDDFTGDLRLLYELTDTLRLAANVGRGFRPPNIFDLGALGPRPGNRFNVANPELRPEHVWSYDLGLKSSGAAWEAEAFVWFLDYADRITSVATGEVTPGGRIVVRGENRDEAELYGLEAGLRWHPRPGLSTSLTVNFTRGEERSPDGSGSPADRVPPLNGRLALAWRPDGRLAVEPEILFAGRQDRLSPRDALDPRIDPRGTPGWVTLSIHLSWQVRQRLSLGLSLNNLTDTAYREHGSGIDAPGRHAGLWIDALF